MTIWTFGDSFANQYKHYPDTWLNILSNKLNMKVKAYGKAFSTSNYCLKKFNQIRDKIEPEDIVIISLSSLNPKNGSYSFGDLHTSIETFKSNKREAYTYHEEYLSYLDELRGSYIINFLHNINHLTKKLNLHTILLITYDDIDDIIQPIKDQFPYLHFSEGTLRAVSRNEWTTEVLNTKDIRWMVTHDVRVNHILKSNHSTLANKLLDNIKNKTPLNFKSGFTENVFDENSMNDLTFIDEELFPSFVRGYKIDRKVKNYVISAVNNNLLNRDDLIRDLLNFLSDAEIKIFLDAYYNKFYKNLIDKI